MSAGRGIPLLSRPPPVATDGNESSCRKCNKEFNLIFSRSRRCNHCGYLYCHSCTDYQALMPRTNQAGTVPPGHDPVAVCAYCIEDLTITASGRGNLRTMPLAKLKKYAKDYNINVTNVLERDELIDRLIAARDSNGCLPPANEDYYRKYSVPKQSTDAPRGFFARARDAMSPGPTNAGTTLPQQPPYQPRTRTTSHPANAFPRPDLDQQQRQRNRPPRQQPQQQAPSYQYQQYNPYVPDPQASRQYFTNPYTDVPPRQGAPRAAANGASATNNARPRSASMPRAPTRATSPSPTIPTLDGLLEMSPEDIRALSISTLKAVLFRNHVQTSMVVEKSELVAKVEDLIADEKLERETAARRAEDEERERREMLEAIEQSKRDEEERQARERERQQNAARQAEGANEGAGESEGSVSEATASSSTQDQTAPDATTPEPTPPPGKLTPKAQAMASHLERTGLCVICQDEEANIAIVDCGHLAMCRTCADLIMSSTRECPLCRTRIVTEARLLRIFKS